MSTVSAVSSKPMFGSGLVMKTGDPSGTKMKPFTMTNNNGKWSSKI